MNFLFLLFSLPFLLFIGQINGRLYKLQHPTDPQQLLLTEDVTQKEHRSNEFLYVFMDPPSKEFPFQTVQSAMLVAWLELAQIEHYIFSNQFLLASPKGNPIFAQFKGEYLEGVDKIIETMEQFRLEKLAIKSLSEKKQKKIEKKEKEFVGALKGLHKILLKNWLNERRSPKWGEGRNRFEFMVSESAGIRERIGLSLLMPIVADGPVSIGINRGIFGKLEERKKQLKIDEQFLREYFEALMDENDGKKIGFMKKHEILILKEKQKVEEIQMEEEEAERLEQKEKAEEKVYFSDFEKEVWDKFANEMRALVNIEGMMTKEFRTMLDEHQRLHLRQAGLCRLSKLELREKLPNLRIKVKQKSNRRIGSISIPFPKKIEIITKKLGECDEEELESSLGMLLKPIAREVEGKFLGTYLFDKKVPGKSEAYLLGLLFFMFNEPFPSSPKLAKLFKTKPGAYFGYLTFDEKKLEIIYNHYYKPRRALFERLRDNQREIDRMVVKPWPMKGAHEQMKHEEFVVARKIQRAIFQAQINKDAQAEYPWLEGLEEDMPSDSE